jgi:hypothetical protein
MKKYDGTEVMLKYSYPMYYIEWSSSRLGRITTDGRAPSTYCIECRLMNIQANVIYMYFSFTESVGIPKKSPNTTQEFRNRDIFL